MKSSQTRWLLFATLALLLSTDSLRALELYTDSIWALQLYTDIIWALQLSAQVRGCRITGLSLSQKMAGLDIPETTYKIFDKLRLSVN